MSFVRLCAEVLIGGTYGNSILSHAFCRLGYPLQVPGPTLRWRLCCRRVDKSGTVLGWHAFAIICMPGGQPNWTRNPSYRSGFSPSLVGYRQSWQCHLINNCADHPTGPITGPGRRLRHRKTGPDLSSLRLKGCYLNAGPRCGCK